MNPITPGVSLNFLKKTYIQVFTFIGFEIAIEIGIDPTAS